MKRLILILSVILLSATVQAQMILPSNPYKKAAAAAADTLGPEKLSNGTFADASDWTTPTGWSIAGGAATFNDVNNGAIMYQASGDMVSSFVNSETYRMEFDVTIASGNAVMAFYNAAGNRQAFALAFYANGHHVVRFTVADWGTNGFGILGHTNSTSSFSISNITIKKVL